MEQPDDSMTEAELAEWQYRHRGQLDSQDGEPVEADVSPQLSITMSFRLPAAEADAIRLAAEQAGLSLSEWIREVCADALGPRSDTPDRRSQALLAALDDLEHQLEVAKARLTAAHPTAR